MRFIILIKKTNLRVKLFVILFIVILIPTVTIGFILYKKSESAITHQTAKAIISSMSQTVENIDSTLKDIEYTCIPVITDTQVLRITGLKNRFDAYEIFDNYSYLKNFLNNISYQNKNIDSYYLYLVNQKDLVTSKGPYFQDLNENEIDFIKKIKDVNNKDILWFITDPIEYTATNNITKRANDYKLLTCAKYIKDSKNNTLGILAINVKEALINDNFINTETNKDINSLVLDKNAEIISSGDNSIIGKKFDIYLKMNNMINSFNNSGSFLEKVKSKDCLVVYNISAYTGWRYIKIIPISQIIGEASDIQKFLLVIIGISILVILGIDYLLVNIFYRPIEKLIYAMQRIERRDLDVKISDKRQDEYGKLYNGFNSMVFELKSLLKDLTNEKILKKEAEIKFLQAQINPHFLYNTLESILSIAKLHKEEEIASMVLSLSKFFRIGLSSGKDFVKLKEALELAITYLTIQNLRFNGKISYTIDVPESVYECKVPKLVLQPIVENSIYHGIEKKEENGTLKIRANISAEILEIIVEDDGIGINENDLYELQQSINSGNFQQGKNFALKNLNTQIQLKYGEQYGIRIESIFGVGTRVIVTLPVIRN